MKALGLYIHIPFCKRKCNYCDFYSCTSTNKIKEYIDAISTQIEKEASLYTNCQFDTVFIGGGTPSLVSKNEIEILIKAIKNNLNLTQGAEFTIEANPGTLTEEKLLAYKNGGVNRLSIGLQSTHNDELKALGRIHTYEEFYESYKLARRCGFDNVSVDVMYSLPSQEKNDFLDTLKKVVGLKPEHISSYCLKIEENTPFAKMNLDIPTDEAQYNMYISMCEFLEQNGYKQYEISNFAKDGHTSKHNLKYWQSEEYVGIGPSAHSYFNGKRYYYTSNLDDYINTISQGAMPKKEYEEETNLSKADEYVMLKMRLSNGVNENEFYEKFSKELLDAYPQIIKYINAGYIEKKENNYHFTPSGFFVSNYILAEILNYE